MYICCLSDPDTLTPFSPDFSAMSTNRIAGGVIPGGNGRDGIEVRPPDVICDSPDRPDHCNTASVITPSTPNMGRETYRPPDRRTPDCTRSVLLGQQSELS